MRLSRLCLFLITFGVLASVRADNPLFGRILNNVVCETDATQSYALYVPSNYTNERRWPVIFCFDPRARGTIPVERLRAVAEKYGYILAGSLTSRNGPYAQNLAASQAMVRDVSAHFSVDPRRVYTAGMSGGARVATSLALSGAAKGVIACGAGFPSLAEGIPLRVPFVFYGIVGLEDSNFSELRRLDDALDERKAVHRIATFDGGHVWAPERALAEAVEWLELQAMRTGQKPKDENVIHVLFSARKAALARLAALEKWRAMKAIVDDFSGLVDTAELAREAAAIGASREIKEALKDEKKLLLRESDLMAELSDAADDSLGSKQRLAASLRQRMALAGNPAERRMLSRAISGYCSISRESARDLIKKSDYPQAAGLLELSAALKPEDARTWFDLSCAYALSGDGKRALESLDRSAGAGFDDAQRLKAEPAFASMQADSRFVEISSKISANRDDPAMQLPAMKISSVLASVELRLMYQAKSSSDFPPLSFLSVVSVRPNSPADAAGLSPGMEITSIQGCRIYDLTEAELYDAMAKTVRGEIVFTLRDSFRGNERTLRMPLGRAPGVASPEASHDETASDDS